MTNALPSSLTYPQQLEKFNANMDLLSTAQPEVMNAFRALHVAGSAEGALNGKN